MHLYYEVKEMLHRELEDIVKQGDISNVSLEVIDKLLNSIKNSEKIIMYNRYSNEGYSYGGEYSTARGRTGNVKRDSMGRYARNDGYSRNGYSRDGYSRGGYSRRDYSYAQDKMSMLEDMMNETDNEQERTMIRNLIEMLEVTTI